MIKRIFSPVVFLSLYCIQLQAQTSETVDVKFRYGTKDRELQDLIQLENIDYQSFVFSGASLVGKHFILIAKEIWKGKVTATSAVANSLTRTPISDSTLEIRVISKIDEAKNIYMYFHFPNLSTRKLFKTTGSSLYSLRNLLDESKTPFVLGKKNYFLAHILPIPVPGSPNMLSYCNVDNSGEDVLQWGKKLGIEHYIVFELEIF